MSVRTWFIAAAAVIALFGITETAFKNEAVVEEATATVGVNITLHQKIVDSVVGGGSVTYRYHLDTDCDHWSYHSAYETDRPLSLTDRMALEAHAYELKIVYDDKVYASGQFFEIPSIGKTTNNETKEEFETRLKNEAWETFEVERTDRFFRYMAAGIVMIGLTVGGIWICRNRWKRIEQ